MIYTAAYCPILMRAEIEMEKYQGNHHYHYHFLYFKILNFFQKLKN